VRPGSSWEGYGFTVNPGFSWKGHGFQPFRAKQREALDHMMDSTRQRIPRTGPKLSAPLSQ